MMYHQYIGWLFEIWNWNVQNSNTHPKSFPNIFLITYIIMPLMNIFLNSGWLLISTYDMLANGLGGLLLGKFSLPITHVEDRFLFRPIDLIFKLNH
jgi:hypothetical protein